MLVQGLTAYWFRWLQIELYKKGKTSKVQVKREREMPVLSSRRRYCFVNMGAFNGRKLLFPFRGKTKLAL